jgi:hypothetical protein
MLRTAAIAACNVYGWRAGPSWTALRRSKFA